MIDEAPEFARVALDALRQPLESGRMEVHRAGFTASYPARFQLVMAMNPCPCGNYGVRGAECTCPPMAIVSLLPSSSRILRILFLSFFGALVCHYHVDLMRHVDTIRNGLIHNKMNLGCIAQIDFLCKTSADKTLCAL